MLLAQCCLPFLMATISAASFKDKDIDAGVPWSNEDEEDSAAALPLLADVI